MLLLVRQVLQFLHVHFSPERKQRARGTLVTCCVSTVPRLG